MFCYVFVTVLFSVDEGEGMREVPPFPYLWVLHGRGLTNTEYTVVDSPSFFIITLSPPSPPVLSVKGDNSPLSLLYHLTQAHLKAKVDITTSESGKCAPCSNIYRTYVCFVCMCVCMYIHSFSKFLLIHHRSKPFNSPQFPNTNILCKYQ